MYMKNKTMKKIVFLLLISLSLPSAKAKKGMWPPFLLESMKKELKQAGLRLKVDDLYSEEHPSLKDAVVIFGGGCTGEIISDQGLVLTNHHCGYGTVQGLSSVDTNYLLQGFFAQSKEQEIPCPGLKVTFIKSYTEITPRILAGSSSENTAAEKDSILRKNIQAVMDSFQSDTNFIYEVSNFYQGNQYYLIRKQVYEDIRLVAFPPNGIGKFGGDTDNWAWPRHTGDFGLFRIYCDTTNEPAKYSPSNVPYKPIKHLEINPNGAQQGAFSMIYGFPGRTSQYISSYEVDNIMHTIDPSRIKCRQAKLDVWNAAMEADEKVFVKYASKQARVANYWKKWQGEIQGLERNNGLQYKKSEESKLINWAAAAGKGNISQLKNLENLFTTNHDLLVAYYYYLEALRGIELTSLVRSIAKMENLKKEDQDYEEKLESVKKSAAYFFKNYELELDKKATIALLQLYKKEVADAYQIDFVRNLDDIQLAVNNSFSASHICTSEGFDSLLSVYEKTQDFTLFSKDEMYIIGDHISKYYEETLKPGMKKYTDEKNKWNQELMAYYHEANTSDKALFPDANFTLRLTYGMVEGVSPEDGKYYKHQTTLSGIPPKYNPKREEFDAPQKLLQLENRKDYGKYAMKGDVPVCFLASNHTTGGNSGSPILDKKGRLIGLNFDRIWEGTMSDIYFDENICRNIGVNIRYILYILDKFGNAPWIVEEMDIVGADLP